MQLTEQQLEQLIEAITREVFCYLGDRQLCELRGLEIDELVCPGCDGRPRVIYVREPAGRSLPGPEDT